MSTPNPGLVAAVPAFKASIAAVRQFLANLGTDPLLVPAKMPGAVAILIGTAQLQVPVLVNAEWGVATAAADAELAKLDAALDAVAAGK